MIKEAAIKKDGKIYTGKRHSDIIKLNPKETFTFRNSIQGFITIQGNFVDRYEAGKIAFKCGQVSKKIRMLTSEDLY